MFKMFGQLLFRRRTLQIDDIEPPAEVVVEGAPPFPLARHLRDWEGYPVADWDAVRTWLNGVPSPDIQARAWSEVERAWMLHFKGALGPSFRLSESSNALLLSSLDANVAQAALDSMERILSRVVKVLDGIAEIPPWGKDLLIVFDDAESYYHYVSYYYPDAGEFAFSSGMHIDAGCSHHVTTSADLRSIEPIIAHEMTHGCVSHLPLPAWLNEGLAVNMERRITSTGPAEFTPQQLHGKHVEFWQEQEVQEFWSGKSFLRTDDGNMLSYDLARIIVEQTAKDWARFRQFVLAADGADAGAAAAREHLGIDLGEAVCALLEKAPSIAWAPNPSAWADAPERGGFSGKR